MTHPPLVSPAWLFERLSAPDIVVLDASWYLPASVAAGYPTDDGAAQPRAGRSASTSTR